jgi:hypothetical protein
MFRVPKDRENIGHKRFFIQKKIYIYIYINNIYKNNIYFIYIKIIYKNYIYIFIYYLYIYILRTLKINAKKDKQSNCEMSKTKEHFTKEKKWIANK